MASSARPLFALVAGESSGDALGAALMVELKQLYPNAEFKGIGGPNMLAQGMMSFFPMARLSVMGFIEPLKRLPELIKIHWYLRRYFLKHRPIVFIGIDSSSFNLALADCFNKAGIKTVQYVAPMLWAWRPHRINRIKRCISKVLTLFPFENAIYTAHQVPVTCVGHSLADQLPLHSDKIRARQMLGLPTDKTIIAILPGSREQELAQLAPTFIQTATWLQTRLPNAVLVTAMVSPERLAQFQALLPNNAPNIHGFINQSQTVMGASDVLLMASGTATLEAMLIKRPTVIAYKMGQWTYALARRLVKVPFIGLPNLLANASLMPEFIQEQASPRKLGQAVLALLNQDNTPLMNEFTKLHQSLRQNASVKAAQAIQALIDA